MSTFLCSYMWASHDKALTWYTTNTAICTVSHPFLYTLQTRWTLIRFAIRSISSFRHSAKEQSSIHCYFSSLLCQGHRQYYPLGSEHNLRFSTLTYRNSDEIMSDVVRFLCHLSKRLPEVLCKRHDSQHRLGCSWPRATKSSESQVENLRFSPITNGAILLTCKTRRHNVASSAESETAGLFHNAQVAIPIRYTLNKIGHLQPATPIETDNATATFFIHDNINQKKFKSWDVRYNWLRGIDQQELLHIYRDCGDTNNHDDYYTKKHPIIYNP